MAIHNDLHDEQLDDRLDRLLLVVEAMWELLRHHTGLSDDDLFRRRRTDVQPAPQLVECGRRSRGQHLDPAIAEILCPAHQAQPRGLLRGAGSKKYTLDFAGNQVAPATGRRHRGSPASLSRASRLRSRASSAISFAARASRRAKDQLGAESPRLR